MRRYLLLIVLGSCGLSNCGGGSAGGGSVGGGSPTVSLSANSFTFGDEVVGTASQPLPITLTNSGTASLAITNIAVSTNFAETNNCGLTLAAGANCVINVTLVPTTTGSLSGTVSATDNGPGSPQTVSLSGTGMMGTTEDTLTGDCFGSGPVEMCSTIQDVSQCPAGQVAINPQTTSGCLPPQSALVDLSAPCQFKNSHGETFNGACVVRATARSGSCSVQGQECGAPELPPCCSGFVCSAASTRAFCQPATAENAARVRSAWEQRFADKLQ